MRGFLSTLLLIGCSEPHFQDYWEGNGPVISGHTPASTDSLLGGETLQIHGSRLTQTRTVVVGGRNAEIISTCEDTVEVILPPGTPGGGLVDITVVTDGGLSTIEDSFDYASPGADLWDDEVASISLYTVRCPIELWTLDDMEEWSELWWCGFEAGYADAYGFDGASPQPGFAGDLMGFAGISALPAAGQSRVRGPGARIQPKPPLVYGVHPDDEAFHVVAERDFQRDLDYMEEHLQLIEDTYYWADSIYRARPTAWLYGEDECYSESMEVLGHEWDRLQLEDEASGVTGIHLGLEIDEIFGVDRPGIFEYQDLSFDSSPVVTSSAAVVGDGEVVIAEDSGTILRYDGWSGYFYPDTVAGMVYPSDLPTSTNYQISHSRLGEVHQLGSVRGVERLELISPTLMTGNLQVDGEDDAPLVHNIGYLQNQLGLDGGLTIEWEPGADSDSGTFIAIELVFYDASIDDPYWMTEVGRIVAQGADAEGMLTIPVDQLLSLPEAPNTVDRNQDLIGVWAELTVARHQLQVLEIDDGDLVIDFVDAINGPISIYHPEASP